MASTANVLAFDHSIDSAGHRIHFHACLHTSRPNGAPYAHESPHNVCDILNVEVQACNKWCNQRVPAANYHQVVGWHLHRCKSSIRDSDCRVLTVWCLTECLQITSAQQPYATFTQLTTRCGHAWLQMMGLADALIGWYKLGDSQDSFSTVPGVLLRPGQSGLCSGRASRLTGCMPIAGVS